MRRTAIVIALLAPATAHADWVAWTPVRIGLTGAVDVPRNSDYVLTDVRIDVAQQIGGAHLNGDAHRGNGPFASLGGLASLGLYSPVAGESGCEDAVDPDDGSKRWTCGRLGLGGTATLGWSWGSLLKSGYMVPERSFYVQLAPFVAAVKRPDIDRTFELDVTASVGYWWSWGGIAARWTRVPGDDYYGAALQLTRGFSEWFAKDEKVDADAVRPTSDSPTPLHIELGIGGSGVVNGGAEDAQGQAHMGVYYRTNAHEYGPFMGIGGAVSLPLGDADAGAIGPAITFGQRGRIAGVYVRARPLIGAHSAGGDTTFDYGVDAAIGFSLTSPHIEEDSDEDNGLGLGLELTAGWIAGNVILGGNVQLLMF